MIPAFEFRGREWRGWNEASLAAALHYSFNKKTGDLRLTRLPVTEEELEGLARIAERFDSDSMWLLYVRLLGEHLDRGADA